MCREVTEEWKKTGKPVIVSFETVRRRLGGGKSRAQFNTKTNAWLATLVHDEDESSDENGEE